MHICQDGAIMIAKHATVAVHVHNSGKKFCSMNNLKPSQYHDNHSAQIDISISD